MDPRVIVLFVACAVSFLAGQRFEAYNTERAKNQVTLLQKTIADATVEKQQQDAVDRAVFDAVMEKKDEERQLAVAARDAHYRALLDRVRREAASRSAGTAAAPEGTCDCQAAAAEWQRIEEARESVLAVGYDCELDAESLKAAQDYIITIEKVYGSVSP